MNLQGWNPYLAEAHQPFIWRGAGKGAALLVHGFPGTPNEIRPLAHSLHQSGWTVQGLLLPGFGRDIERLGAYRKEDWVTAVVEAMTDLRLAHEVVVSAGYSMGAAVSLAATAVTKPDGLLLLAPFWRLPMLPTLLLRLLTHIFPTVQLFKRLNFQDARVREGVATLVGGHVDLDDPAVTAVLRDLRVPTIVWRDVLDLGEIAQEAALTVALPTLALQGKRDPLVKPKFTRQLLQQMSGAVSYRELEMDHELIDPAHPEWPHLERAVLDFVGQVQRTAVGERP